MNRLIIVGSPRTNGRSAALAELLFETCIEEYPDDEVALAPVSTLDINPCQGCDACKALAMRSSAGVAGEAEGEADDGAFRRCVIDDDMADIYELIDTADELVVVSPVYFAGAPAQLKALLDRLQPYFWTDARLQAKRPATLHVVGEGGDPHGFEPLVGVVRSSLSCAGFTLERVLDWVGKIDEEGDITAEAVEHPLAPLPGLNPAALSAADQDAPVEKPAAANVAPTRPALRLSPEGKPSQAGAKAPRAKGNSHTKQGATKQGAPSASRPRQSTSSANHSKQSAPGTGHPKQGQPKSSRSQQGGSKQNRSKQGGKRRG